MSRWHTRNPRLVAWLGTHGIFPTTMERIEGTDRYAFSYAERPCELVDQFVDGLANPYHEFLNVYFDALGQAKDAFRQDLASAPFVTR